LEKKCIGTENASAIFWLKIAPGVPTRVAELIRRKYMILLVIALSLFVIGFWTIRHSETRIVRRVFSIGNTYDMSWRNRVEAYVGALRIMAHYPWLGLGWGQSEEVYSEYFQSDRLLDGRAILLNDYFTIGMALGLSALVCFLGYVWLKFLLPRKDSSRLSNRPFARTSEWSKRISQAGALVLLVGFWFDRGLLIVPLGALFWLLIE